MPNIFVNGKLVNLPNSEATPEQIIKASGSRVPPETRAVQVIGAAGAGNKKLKPGEYVHLRDGEKVKTSPDWIKASVRESYFGDKEPWRKELIEQQVAQVSEHFFKNSPVELDDKCNWVVFDGFLLPKAWQDANPGKKFVPMMIIFPDQYPDLPTNGFYLPSSLEVPENAAHFYSRGYGGAFGGNEDEMRAMADANWNWYCTHIKPGAWQPAKLKTIEDWKHGDNLWDILTISIDVLTYPKAD